MHEIPTDLVNREHFRLPTSFSELTAESLTRMHEHGGHPPSFDVAWQGYAAGQLYGVFSWVNTYLEMQPLKTIYTLLSRHLDAMADLETLDLLV